MTVLEHMRSVFDVRTRVRKAAKLPPLASLQGYELGDLPHDFMAGLLVAALSIPIAMGYAQIAGLSPVYGLYASILPAIAFALVTNTRSIVFGLDSAVAAVTGGVVMSAGVALGSEQAFMLMPLLTMLVALFLLLFAFTRAGSLVHYVPEPVMNGFILGISITIIFRQIPKLAGTGGLDLLDLPAFVAQANVPSVVLSLFALCALFFIGSKAPKMPGALVVLVFGLHSFDDFFFFNKAFERIHEVNHKHLVICGVFECILNPFVRLTADIDENIRGRDFDDIRG